VEIVDDHSRYKSCKKLLIVLCQYHCRIVSQGLVVALMGLASHAQAVLVIRNADRFAAGDVKVDAASRFYGLGVKNMMVGKQGQNKNVIKALKHPDLLAALISGDAISSLNHREVFAALRRPSKQSVPLFLLDILPSVRPSLLSRWSNGRVTGCKTPDHSSDSWELAFSENKEINEQLSGIQLPFKMKVECGLVLAGGPLAEVLIQVSNPRQTLPLLVTSLINKQRIFVLPTVPQGGPDTVTDSAKGLTEVFSSIAPLMVVLHYAAGDKAWHSVGHYANLSIDDPWLVEPYGHLRYSALLEEMKRHNFHTTVSFIPWNFDRSHAEAVSLFRRNRNQLSICVHGNNHNHKEFGDLGTVSLDKQVTDIRKAIGRMEVFTQLTGVPYERVMVFPHSTAPEATLKELKRYGFLATAYSLDLPSGAVRPTDPLFYLRSFNQDFANSLGLNRYSAEVGVSRSELAMQAFLGNPILFYGHQNLFEAGIATFDSFADTVNTLQPDTRWCSLGCVAQHLYFVKRRADGNLDAEMLSSSVVFENVERKSERLFVRKREDFTIAIQSLTVDGNPQSFRKLGEYLTFTLFVPPGESRFVRINYLNSWDIKSTDISKTGVAIRLLRNISDFRDMTLSRFEWGRALTRSYYGHGMDSVELKIERTLPAVTSLIVLATLLAAGWRYRQKGNQTDEAPRT
jgi:hypothetical protein